MGIKKHYPRKLKKAARSCVVVNYDFTNAKSFQYKGRCTKYKVKAIRLAYHEYETYLVDTANMVAENLLSHLLDSIEKAKKMHDDCIEKVKKIHDNCFDLFDPSRNTGCPESDQDIFVGIESPFPEFELYTPNAIDDVIISNCKGSPLMTYYAKNEEYAK